MAHTAADFGRYITYGDHRRDFAVFGHDDLCTGLVLECIDQNARDDGQSVPEWGLDVEDEVWGCLVAELIASYLEDGTATCQCRRND